MKVAYAEVFETTFTQNDLDEKIAILYKTGRYSKYTFFIDATDWISFFRKVDKNAIRSKAEENERSTFYLSSAGIEVKIFQCEIPSKKIILVAE